MAARAGVVTPQKADEFHFRKRLALPPMGADASQAWDDEGGVRRPITLAAPSGEATPPPADPFAGDVGTGDEATGG